LHTPELLGEQAVPLQGIYHELLDLKNQAFQNFEEEIVLNGFTDANLDVASANDFAFDSVLWMRPCLLPGFSLPVTGAIAKLSASGKLIAMAPKLFVSEYQTSAYDAMHGKQLFADSIGGEESGGFCCQCLCQVGWTH